MDEALNRKKKALISIFYYAIILGLFYFFMRYAFGIFLPFLIAILIAFLVQRPTNFLDKKLPVKRGIISTVLVLLLVSVIAIFIIFVGAQIVSAVKNFASFLSHKIDSFPDFFNAVQRWVYKKISFLPDNAEAVVHKAMDSLIGSLSSLAASSEVSSATSNVASFSGFDLSTLSGPISGIWSFAKGIPSLLISCIVSIIAACFVAADYGWLKKFIVLQFKGKNRLILSRSKEIFRSSVLKLLKAYAIIIFITFCEMALGLKILSWLNIYKGGYIVFIAIITAVVDIMPVLGTGTILIPWAIYSFIMGAPSMGIALLVLYGVITVARQFIEPKLVAGQLGLPPFVTILGMYVGLKLFGVIGMLMVPLIIIMLKLLNDDGIIHLWTPFEKKPVGAKTDAAASESKADTVSETDK
ncbi:MAG: sporulation integral membrane protein YtvI [Clostridia bacterium]|nr:sporulation integral membrane protein YtvI [Clostridia bacterium]